MELKEFITKALIDIEQGVYEANNNSIHKMYVTYDKDNKSVEFDVAVTAESTSGSNAGGGIKVLEFVQLGGKAEESQKNTSITRIKFGVHFNIDTKKEESNYLS